MLSPKITKANTKAVQPSQCMIFFGSAHFAVPALEALIRTGYVICVVTVPDKPAGKTLALSPPPIKAVAQKCGLEVYQPSSLKTWDIRTAIPRFPAFGVVTAYGKIIPKEVIDAFPKGLLNIHPSLLPNYRGPSPIQATIINGDAVTGVTLMLLDEEMDHGPIIAQREVKILPHDTTPTLSERLAKAGADMLVETLPSFLKGEMVPIPQHHAHATFTKLIEKEDGKINWNEGADAIERKLRAYTPWPGIWTTWNGKRIKIITLNVHQKIVPLPPGTISRAHKKTLLVSCGNGGAIEITRLQIEGKGLSDAEEFLNGYPTIDGARLA